MTLNRGIVPVIFEGGLDQKTNYKVTAPGKFLLLQNSVRRKTALLEKRWGFTSLSTTSWSSATQLTISSGVGLSYLNQNLILFDGKLVHNYQPGQSAWTTGQVFDVCDNNTVSSVDLPANGSFQTQPDICRLGKYILSVWLEPSTVSTQTIWYSVTEDITGSVIVPPTGLVHGTRPKVAAYANATKAIIGYINGSSNLAWYVFDSATPHSVPVAGVNTDLVTVSNNWDMCSYDTTRVQVVFGAPNGIRFEMISGTGLVAPSSFTYTTGAGVYTDGCVNVVTDSANSKMYVSHSGTVTGGDLNCVLHTVGVSTYNYQSTATISLNVGGLLHFNVGGVLDTNSAVRCFYESHHSFSSAPLAGLFSTVSCAKITSPAGVVTIVSENTVNMTVGGAITGSPGPLSMVSKPFYTNGYAYTYTTYESAIVGTYYLLRSDGAIVSRFLEGSASGYWKTITLAGTPGTYNSTSLASGLPNVYADSSGGYATVLGKYLVSGIKPDLTGWKFISLSLAIFTTSFSTSVCSRQVQNTLMVAGGIPRLFDGSYVVEQGFNTTPRDLHAAVQVLAGGAMSVGTYTVAVTYEWHDSTGNRYQSSPVFSFATTTGGNQTIFINANNQYQMTAYPRLATTSGGTVIGGKIVIWISSVNAPDVLYRYAELSNATTSLSASADVDSTQEVLYTTGGILPNDPAPACTCIHVHKNRVWLGGLVTSEIAFSKTLGETESVSFSDNFRIRIEQAGGPVTSLNSLDDKLVIFKKAKLYYIVGEGPADTGANFDYPEPIPIPFQVGTIYPNSIVETPQGLIFKSDRGFHMLMRNLTIQYIGASVEDFNTLTVTSASVSVNYNEARFGHSDGSTLVYNLDFNQWSEFTNYNSVGAVFLPDGNYYHLKSNGVVNEEIVNQYNDNSTTIDMVIETSWLSMAQLQGFQRLWKMLLVGDFFNDFHLKLSIAYDLQNVYTQVKTISSVGLNQTNLLQLRIEPAQQKCESFKLKLETIDDITVGGGANFKPTALTLEIGRKRGAYKLSSTQTV